MQIKEQTVVFHLEMRNNAEQVARFMCTFKLGATNVEHCLGGKLKKCGKVRKFNIGKNVGTLQSSFISDND
jgi:hypothetical protein